MSRSRREVLLVDKRTAEQITDAFEKLFKRCGIDPIECMEALMDPLRATPEERAMARDGVRSIFLSRLEVAPEPNIEDLSRMLVAFRGGLSFFRKTMLERAIAIPPERGGRPKLLKKNQEADLNARISEQLSQGVEKKDAIRSAAAKYGVSIWTAKRAWKRFQTSTRIRKRSVRKPRTGRRRKWS
jgi:hypothetical protein